jgi:hypothetical protein
MQETLSISNALNGNRKTEHKVAIASARKMNRRMAAKLTAAVLAVIAAGCGTAKVADRHSVGDMTVSKPRGSMWRISSWNRLMLRRKRTVTAASQATWAG